VSPGRLPCSPSLIPVELADAFANEFTVAENLLRPSASNLALFSAMFLSRSLS